MGSSRRPPSPRTTRASRGCSLAWPTATPCSTMTSGSRSSRTSPTTSSSTTLSREQKNKAGGKMYIQDKVGEYADEVFTRMDNGGHMYFCSLKGMMPGILEMLDGVSKEKAIVWEDKL